jgi:uncharacterized membrane protein YbjE (DUF340 family)
LSSFQGSLRILFFFFVGVMLARCSLLPLWLCNTGFAVYALYLLVFMVGISLGADCQAFRIVRDMRMKILAVPLLIVVGTFAGSALAGLALQDMGLRDALCVGMGFGYYSLSSILIESAGNSALASVALLSNIMREIMALLCAPLLARYCGGLASVGAAGATAMDTTLPVIARFSGEQVAVIAAFSGMVLTLLAPVLITIALQW